MLVAYATSEDLDNPAHPRSHARALAARTKLGTHLALMDSCRTVALSSILVRLARSQHLQFTK